MSGVVSVREVIEELEELSFDFMCFIDRRTGEIHTYSREHVGMVEDGVSFEGMSKWEEEIGREIEEFYYSDACLTLPDKDDINDYRIMQKFCLSVEDDDLSDRLLDAISGRGAFRRFRDLVRRLKIDDDWEDYKYRAYEEIVIDFLEKHQISYQRSPRRK